MKIDFEFDTEHGVYRDALHFADDAVMPDDAEIEVLKQQRLTRWLETLEAMRLQAEAEAAAEAALAAAAAEAARVAAAEARNAAAETRNAEGA